MSDDAITHDDYDMNLQLLWVCAHLVHSMPLMHMLAEIAHADSVAPTVDSTLYRKQRQAVHEDRELIEAFVSVQTTMNTLAARTRKERSE